MLMWWVVRRATPAHVVRCVLGTTLRLAVYGSILNLGLSFAGKTEGFWATKVCSLCCLPSHPLPPGLQRKPVLRFCLGYHQQSSHPAFCL